MSVRMLKGDAITRLSEVEAGSIDACVTDPPYGLKFMGKAWDHGVPGAPYWSEVLRVLKPGAHLLAFGGTRTHHRLMVAIEDAGFEIRDCLMWLYGSGFPKGKGCLKPGWEPIVLARKPAPAPWLNVDGCRVGTESTRRPTGDHSFGKDSGWNAHNLKNIVGGSDSGRWPANVVLSHEDGCREVGTKQIDSGRWGKGKPRQNGASIGYGGSDGVFTTTGAEAADGTETVAAFECQPNCAVRMLDEQSGERPVSGSAKNGRPATALMEGGYGGWAGKRQGTLHNDTGGASRFFYCSKASPTERGAYNSHPTVKPLALMQWLVRLVTPAGGTVLDPFCGSGSTLVAADREGFDAIGIDSDPHAIEITRRRVTEDARMFAEVAG